MQRQQGRARRVADLLDLGIAAHPLSEMADDGVLAAADHLQQHTPRAGIGDLHRVEIADRRELPVTADRQPVIEHRGVLPPLPRIDGLEGSSSASAEAFSTGSMFGMGAPIPVSLRT